MDRDNLKAALVDRQVRYFESIDSTNSEALRWLTEVPSLTHGSLVVADEQTQGRGRLARPWQTPPGSAIAMSLILRSNVLPQHLVMAASVAVADVIQSYVAQPVDLKWPNDVLIAGKKICGILAEAVWESDAIKALILGIGINLTVDFSATDLAEHAASVADFDLTQTIDRKAIIVDIVGRLDYWLNEETLYHPGLLYITWKNRLVTIGQWVVMQVADVEIEGQAIDVDSQGALLIENVTGEIKRFLAGDVSLKKR